MASGVAANSGDRLVNNRRVGEMPEPATWAMLLVGFGVVGVALRRRQTRARRSGRCQRPVPTKLPVDTA